MPRPFPAAPPSIRLAHPEDGVSRYWFDFAERPFLVIWEVTRACHLACHHCRAMAQAHPHPDELTTDEGRALIDQVARLGPALFILTGGDPALRPDLLELVRHASDHGLRVGLSPSATPRLMRTDFHALADAGVKRMSLSLDGPTQAEHDDFRGVRGAWGWTFRAIEMAHDAGITVQINTTISRRNIHRLPDFERVLTGISPEMWSLFLLVPTGRAGVGEMPSAEETEAFLQALHKTAGRLRFPVKTTEAHQYRRIQLQHGASLRKGMRAPVGISDGRGFVFVSHRGEICPSGFLPLVTGNIRSHELGDVYRDGPWFRALRDPARFSGKCGRCEYRGICGGSRARAFALTGDPLASDPSCPYKPIPAESAESAESPVLTA